MIRRLVVVLALSAAALAPAPASAQRALELADSLAAAGMADDAREALMGWWEEEGADAPRASLQRALWLRGLLTVDPRQASLDFQRLVVEYPGGPHTDAALLRLAQNERAVGRPGRAAEHLRALVRDYPSSPQRLRARTLLAEVEAEAERAPGPSMGDVAPERPPAEAPSEEVRVPQPAPAADRGETEPPSEAATAARSVESAAPPGAEERSAEAAAVPAGRFAVQLGAFSTVERARALFGRARAAGLEPRMVRVPGSALVRVRADRFLTRDGAERRLAHVRSAGFDALVVVDADREEDVP
ncbi:MAG: SPOR domain-containing protein [Gemmatimonadetes bacterium]|nr:SPOR domain-containing protein [Gemmatimonadota bacterium]